MRNERLWIRTWVMANLGLMESLVEGKIERISPQEKLGDYNQTLWEGEGLFIGSGVEFVVS